MPTLLNPDDREALLHRLHRLEASSQPRWGTFTAPRMVCHLVDALRIGVGEQAVRRVDNLASRTILKWLVVYSPLHAPPGKVQTAPEMLTTAPASWSDDVGRLERLIGRLGTKPTDAVHPFFGPLTHGGWGRLAWKHVDHHLRQFGC